MIIILLIYFNLKTDLRKKINGQINGAEYNSTQIIKWSKELLKGIKYIHDEGIMHRNIEPEFDNFFIMFFIM